jgi:hypothetical protein
MPCYDVPNGEAGRFKQSEAPYLAGGGSPTVTIVAAILFIMQLYALNPTLNIYSLIGVEN